LKKVTKLYPGSPGPHSEEFSAIVEFWMEIERSGDAGATTWEVLDRIRNRVTECLRQDSPNLIEARRLTAEAIGKIEGVIRE
jgi:hypothetical protein